jgi:hypothetical protein
MPILLAAGAMTTVMLMLVRTILRKEVFGLWILAAAWLAVIVRIAVLALIDVSSFPATTPLYLGYAFRFSCLASILSIYQFSLIAVRWRTARQEKRFPAGA